ncbi:uncharacterized protein LOC124363760 [Homalodisca vitripennis]|uniref:uncharacterized protein LOC124363760 n=1 Tax=Homalodisca vitripennis TaxID=197043 RepID=UPI001EEC7B0D|nr:uncharacterized protein LOC124363760 [Homalodisca vitripennis]
MPCCAYSGCTNHTDFGKTLGISFHRFPRNPQAAELWASACGRTEVFSVLTARVCSEHFLDEDYERDLKSELMNTDRKRLLRHSAVPSLSPSRPRSSISAYRCGLKRITKRRARNRTENSVGIPGDPNFVDDFGDLVSRRLFLFHTNMFDLVALRFQQGRPYFAQGPVQTFTSGPPICEARSGVETNWREKSYSQFSAAS